MARPSILSRLANGERLLLDGATGSELQHRGVNVSRGVSADGVTLGAWSATAIAEAPEVVRSVHEDYMRVGADIVTANSYNTNRGILAMVGLEAMMEEFSRKSVELARAARDKYNPAGYVAGAIAPIHRMPYGWDPAQLPPESKMLREWTDQTAVLAAAGADLILIESMYGIRQILPAVQAAGATGLPVFLGIQATMSGNLESGESQQQMVAALGENRVNAILLMCSTPEEISASLPELRAAWSGPVGAYANLGYVPAHKPLDETGRQYHDATVRYSPQMYATRVKEWLAMGTQIVGGCCASSPEHIAALRPMVT